MLYNENNNSQHLEQPGNSARDGGFLRVGTQTVASRSALPGSDVLTDFSALFSGRLSSFGASSGDRAWTEKRPLTEHEYARHLSAQAVTGEWSLGLNPLRDDDTVLFAALDFDAKDLSDEDVHAILQRAHDLELPLVWTRSKSNGLHGWLFFEEPVEAAGVRSLLADWGKTLGWSEKQGGSSKGRGDRFFEIFPKQDRLANGEHGNWIRLPWPGGNAATSRRGIALDSAAPSFQLWIATAVQNRITKSTLSRLLRAMERSRSSPAVPIERTTLKPGANEDALLPLPTPRDSDFTIAEARTLVARLSGERRDDYESWTMVLMALHHQFAGTADEADAIALATDWSAASHKYQAGDVEAKWRSFKARNDGAEITVRSLRLWAETDSPKESAEQGVARLNTHYAYVFKGGGAILETPANGEPDFHDARRFKEFHANQLVLIDGKYKNLGDVWIKHPDRRSYHTVVFDPKAAPRTAVPSKSGPPGSQDFNLWPGIELKPSRTGSCDLFKAHLKDVVCGGDERLYDWVLQWLAHIVQDPTRLAGTALALRGPQGSGKTLVGEIVGRILGSRLYTKTSRPDELTGRFNGHQEGRLLIQVEEGFWAGEKKAESALKNMITSPTLRIERKFMDPLEISNYARVLITSNSSWIVPAALGERRFAVLDVSGHRANDFEYFEALRRQMFDEGGCERFLDFLLNDVTVDWKSISRPPETEALLEQQLQSLGAGDHWLFEMLRRGMIPGDLTGQGVTEHRRLQTAFSDAMRIAGRTWDGTPVKLGHLLRQGLGEKVTNGRPRSEDGTRPYTYQFASLSECRARFAQQFAYPIQWEGPEEWRPYDPFGDNVV